MQHAPRSYTWIMRGHPAITIKWFFVKDGGGGGVWPAQANQTQRWALAFGKDGGGRHISRCVLSRAQAHLTHSA
eukprot:1568780-Pyramimonas_sp.AAC.1